jgi:hypothetical protein
MTRRPKAVIAILACVLAAAWASRAEAASPTVRHDVASSTSSNWAGYAVSAPADSTTPVTYTTVSGAWKQPAATCTAGSSGYSAFWVGLGGFSDTSQGLEQIGTESDCTADGRATYAVWYELVPAASVPVKLVIHPGDTFTASVAVTGQKVTVKITNLTRKKTFTKKLTMSTPDVSSAEWIAEAPSTCSNSGNCRTLPLANFASITFASARATAAGHLGTIADPAWSATAISLASENGGFGDPRFATAVTTAQATPSPLSATGGSFSVAWSEAQPTTEPGA